MNRELLQSVIFDQHEIIRRVGVLLPRALQVLSRRGSHPVLREVWDRNKAERDAVQGLISGHDCPFPAGQRLVKGETLKLICFCPTIIYGHFSTVFRYYYMR